MPLEVISTKVRITAKVAVDQMRSILEVKGHKAGIKFGDVASRGHSEGSGVFVMWILLNRVRVAEEKKRERSTTS